MKKISTNFLVLTFLFLNLFPSCETDDNEDLEFNRIELEKIPEDIKDENILKDPRDGKKYQTVKIGNQIWMAENLNYDVSGSLCYGYNNYNCDKYGKLYKWHDAKSICPEGWHLPSLAEWNEMITFLGGPIPSLNKLKAKTIWTDTNNTITNESLFSALPAGFASRNQVFFLLNTWTRWWTSNEESLNVAKNFIINDYDIYISSENNLKSDYYSCRCVKD